ncbi:SRPBCC family protein [Georgenia phoenicis]|uniref:SRPBCC family protein n=1 Tax=unclassified Georgenia TaxID=2626815 RepID=UPI0039B07795
MRSRHISRVVAASPAVVYEYAADPANLPAWAAGLAEGEVRQEGDAVVVDSPMGRVEVTFVRRNPFGVLDHDVRLPSGEVVTNPVRVLAHPEGAEVVFTLRQLGLSDADFERDAAMVERDLEALARIVEGDA